MIIIIKVSNIINGIFLLKTANKRIRNNEYNKVITKKIKYNIVKNFPILVS